MVAQVIGFIGAACVLFAYWFVASGRHEVTSYPVIAINAYGAALLLGVGVYTMQVGYILLNAAWLFIAWRTLQRRLVNGSSES